MDEWNPNMDEAPRDGTPILVAVPEPIRGIDVEPYVPWGETRVIMVWWEGSHIWDSHNGWFAGFTEDGCADTYGYSYPIQVPIPVMPTHWMPLPSPPDGKEG